MSEFVQIVCAALKEAAEAARQKAIRHGTKLVVWRDGKVAEIDPNDIPSRD